MNIVDLPIELKDFIIDHDFHHISLINKFYYDNLQDRAYRHKYMVEIINYKLLAFYHQYEYVRIDMNNIYISDNIYTLLINCNNIVFIKYFCNIYKNTHISTNTNYCNDSAAHGKLYLLKYFYKNGFRCTEYTHHHAICYGHLNCLKYLHKHDYPNQKIIINHYMSYYGHKKCIKYAYIHGYMCTQKIIDKYSLTQYDKKVEK